MKLNYAFVSFRRQSLINTIQCGVPFLINFKIVLSSRFRLLVDKHIFLHCLHTSDTGLGVQCDDCVLYTIIDCDRVCRMHASLCVRGIQLCKNLDLFFSSHRIINDNFTVKWPWTHYTRDDVFRVCLCRLLNTGTYRTPSWFSFRWWTTNNEQVPQKSSLMRW